MSVARRQKDPNMKDTTASGETRAREQLLLPPPLSLRVTIFSASFRRINPLSSGDVRAADWIYSKSFARRPIFRRAFYRRFFRRTFRPPAPASYMRV